MVSKANFGRTMAKLDWQPRGHLKPVPWGSSTWHFDFALLAEQGQGYKIALKINFLTKASRPSFTYTYRLRIKHWTNVCASVRPSVCPPRPQCHSLAAALAVPILAKAMSFDPPRCLPRYRKVSLNLVNYTKSYWEKLILPKIQSGSCNKTGQIAYR